MLTSVCSDNPETELRWRITNANAYELNVGWDIYGTSQSGTVTVPAYGENYFTSVRLLNKTNTARLFLDSQQVDAKVSTLMACPKPSPTATSTPEGKIVICHFPPSRPDDYHMMEVTASALDGHLGHGDYIGPCREKTPTPLPTVQATHTATPQSEVVVGGTIRGKNGRTLSNAEKRRLSGIDMRIKVIEVGGERIRREFAVSEDYSYSMPLKKGQYQIILEGEGRLAVTSKPKRYNLWILKNQELNFAVRTKNSALSVSSRKVRRRQ